MVGVSGLGQMDDFPEPSLSPIIAQMARFVNSPAGMEKKKEALRLFFS